MVARVKSRACESTKQNNAIQFPVRPSARGKHIFPCAASSDAALCMRSRFGKIIFQGSRDKRERADRRRYLSFNHIVAQRDLLVKRDFNPRRTGAVVRLVRSAGLAIPRTRPNGAIKKCLHLGEHVTAPHSPRPVLPTWPRILAFYDRHQEYTTTLEIRPAIHRGVSRSTMEKRYYSECRRGIFLSDLFFSGSDSYNETTFVGWKH